MATSHLDSMLMSSIKALSQDNCAQSQHYTLPGYIQEPHFKEFLSTVGSEIQPNDSGYIAILTNKECYTNGELVTGVVYIDLFQPSVQKDIFIKFKGEQRVPDRLSEQIDDRSFVNHNEIRLDGGEGGAHHQENDFKLGFEE